MVVLGHHQDAGQLGVARLQGTCLLLQILQQNDRLLQTALQPLTLRVAPVPLLLQIFDLHREECTLPILALFSSASCSFLASRSRLLAISDAISLSRLSQARLRPAHSLKLSSIWTEHLWICILIASISLRRSAMFLRFRSILILPQPSPTYARSRCVPCPP